MCQVIVYWLNPQALRLLRQKQAVRISTKCDCAAVSRDQQTVAKPSPGTPAAAPASALAVLSLYLPSPHKRLGKQRLLARASQKQPPLLNVRLLTAADKII